MFGFSFLQIFAILIGIAFFIYKFQAFMTVIDGFKDWIKRKKKYEADKLKYSPLQNKLNEIIENGDMLNQYSLESIYFHLVKLVDLKDNCVMYFSITGGAISNIEINSENSSAISVEPKSFIANNSSGQINFTKNNSEIDIITFEIHFDDDKKNRQSKKYLVSISEEKLLEL